MSGVANLILFQGDHQIITEETVQLVTRHSHCWYLANLHDEILRLNNKFNSCVGKSYLKDCNCSLIITLISQKEKEKVISTLKLMFWTKRKTL